MLPRAQCKFRRITFGSQLDFWSEELDTFPMWVIAGLGNPDKEHEGTRHNVGRDVLRAAAKKEGVDSWKEDKKTRSLAAKGELFGKKALLLLPQTFMNNSGGALKPLIASKKAAEGLVVLHDDLDLPLGTVKISFGSGSGGHRGVESVQKALKTRDFVRIRIGISPSTPGGKTKKPDSEKVIDFVLGKFRAPEEEKLKKVRKTVGEALELILTEGRERAMNEIHSK